MSAGNPRDWLGRGLENVPGKSLGWAWHQERAAIREHLLARGFDTSGRLGRFNLGQRVDAIQARIHRYRPTMRERQKALHLVRVQQNTQPDAFTRDQLLRIAERFGMDNDPEGQAIAKLAAAHARHLIGD